uniref:Uncharacterized protein n=1 Tax=Ascaris lumbricoides TaxID=6252 RepID=A0A0M3IHU4_ASCLU
MDAYNWVLYLVVSVQLERLLQKRNSERFDPACLCCSPTAQALRLQGRPIRTNSVDSALDLNQHPSSTSELREACSRFLSRRTAKQENDASHLSFDEQLYEKVNAQFGAVLDDMTHTSNNRAPLHNISAIRALFWPATAAGFLTPHLPSLRSVQEKGGEGGGDGISRPPLQPVAITIPFLHTIFFLPYRSNETKRGTLTCV